MSHYAIVLASPEERAAEREGDAQFEDVTLTACERDGDWLSVSTDAGWGASLRWPADAPAAAVGDRVRVWGGWGHEIRGVSLWRGVELIPISYSTKAERDAEHGAWIADSQRRQRGDYERDRPKLDAAYEALPLPLKRRIDRFRAADPDFRWREEAYEMAACSEAGRLYRAALDPVFGAALKAAGIKGPTEEARKKPSYQWEPSDGTPDWEDTPENRLVAFDAINSSLNGYAYGRMHEFLPDMDDGHSGNTWGHAVVFARELIRHGDAAAL